MFQAELRPAKLLRSLVEALKEVVNEVTLECSNEKIRAQAMDSSHVSLIDLELRADKFQSYRCEKAMTLGINVGSLSKILKCAANDDTVQLNAQDGGDQLDIRVSDQTEDRVSTFSMKLMDIEADQLGIPQQEYACSINFPSSEFSRICKDVANFGDSVVVEVKKDGVSFSAQGDIGTGKMLLKAQRELDVKQDVKDEAPKEGAAEGTKKESSVKKEKTEETTIKTEEGANSPSPRKPASEEKTPSDTKKEGDEDTKPNVNDDDAGDAAAPPKKRARKDKEEKEAKPEPQGVRIECKEIVKLQFALRYLTMFSKAQSVSETVCLKMVKDSPLLVEYEIPAPGGALTEAEQQEGKVKPAPLGTLRYFLAPKVGDEGEEGEAGEAAAGDE